VRTMNDYLSSLDVMCMCSTLTDEHCQQQTLMRVNSSVTCLTMDVAVEIIDNFSVCFHLFPEYFTRH